MRSVFYSFAVFLPALVCAREIEAVEEAIAQEAMISINRDGKQTTCYKKDKDTGKSHKGSRKAPCTPPPPGCPPDLCAFNAPKILGLRCDLGIYVTGSYLYWEAIEDNLEPAYLSLKVDEDETRDQIQQSMLEMDWGYRSAFKVGVGYTFCKDTWDLYSEYLSYHTTAATKHAFIEDVLTTGLEIVPLWPKSIFSNVNPSDSDVNIDASATWTIGIDQIDLSLGREYYVGQCLVFHPRFGLRGLFLDQHYDADYVREVLDEMNPYSGTISSQNKISSRGIGPLMTLDAVFKLWQGVHLFGTLGGSILYTNYDRQMKGSESLVQVDDTTVNGFLWKDSDLRGLRPAMDFALGVGLGDCFFSKRVYVDIAISYDFHILWNQNMFLDAQNAGRDGLTATLEEGYGVTINNQFILEPRGALPNGDLYLHGVTATLSFSF